MALEGIRTVETKKDAIGNYEQVRVFFGPHYFIELHCERNGKVTFVLGATHHGFKADASQGRRRVGELHQRDSRCSLE